MLNLVLISNTIREVPTLHPSFQASKGIVSGLKYVLLSRDDSDFMMKVQRSISRGLTVLVQGMPRTFPLPKGYDWRSFSTQKLGEVACPFPNCWALLNFARFESWKFNFFDKSQSFGDWQIPLDPRCKEGGQDIKDRNDRLPWRAKNWIGVRDLRRMPLWLLNDPVRVYMERSDKTDFLFRDAEKKDADFQVPEYFPIKRGEEPDIISEGVGYKLRLITRKGLGRKFLTGPEVLERAHSNFSWMGSLAGWPLRYCPPKWLFWWARGGEFSGASSTKVISYFIPWLQTPSGKSRPPSQEEKSEILSTLKATPSLGGKSKSRIVVLNPVLTERASLELQPTGWKVYTGEQLPVKPFVSEQEDRMEIPTGELGEAIRRFTSTPEFYRKIWWKEEIDEDLYRDLQSFRGVWTGRGVIIDQSVSIPLYQKLLLEDKLWPILFSSYLDPSFSHPILDQIQASLKEQRKTEEVWAEEYSEYGWGKRYIPIRDLPKPLPVTPKEPQPVSFSLGVRWCEWRERGCLSPPVIPVPDYICGRKVKDVTAEEREYIYADPSYSGGDVWGKWGSFMGSPVFLDMGRERSLRDRIIQSLQEGDDDQPTFQTGRDEWAGRVIIRQTYPVLSPLEEPGEWEPPAPLVFETFPLINDRGIQVFHRDGRPVMVKKNTPPDQCTEKQYRMGLRGTMTRLSQMHQRLTSLVDAWRKRWEMKLSLVNNNHQDVREFYLDRAETLDHLLVEKGDLDWNLWQWVEAGQRNTEDPRMKADALRVLSGELVTLFYETRSLLRVAQTVVTGRRQNRKIRSKAIPEREVKLSDEDIRVYLIKKMTEGWFVTDALGNVSLADWMEDVIKGRARVGTPPETRTEEEIVRDYLYESPGEEDEDLEDEEVEEEEDDEEDMWE